MICTEGELSPNKQIKKEIICYDTYKILGSIWVNLDTYVPKLKIIMY